MSLKKALTKNLTKHELLALKDAMLNTQIELSDACEDEDAELVETAFKKMFEMDINEFARNQEGVCE